MFVTDYSPPPNRVGHLTDGSDTERHLKEGAVMLAFAMHLLNEPGSDGKVLIHPDGQHAKATDFQAVLGLLGFALKERRAKSLFAGTYVRDREVVEVLAASGRGDIVGMVNGRRVFAEAKGGCINSRHAGQQSKIRRSLFEAVGSLFQLPPEQGRQVAVVPFTDLAYRLASQLVGRTVAAGIEIALVKHDGQVVYATPSV